MQSGGGPLQPGPVMRGLPSGTPTSSQQQPDMQKMQSQPPLMNQQPYQQQQQQNLYRAPANPSTRPTRPLMTPYHHHTQIFAPYAIQPATGFHYNRVPGQWPNYGSMPYQAPFFMPAPIIQGQNRRPTAGENNLVNVNSPHYSAVQSNGATNLNPPSITPIPQMQQVPLQQQPNQQSSPMAVSHDQVVMMQLHSQQPQQTGPQQVAGGGQAGPMDQHPPNPAQVNVGGPQAPNTMMSQMQLSSHLASAPAAKLNKKKQRGSRAIPIINPDTQEDVLDKIYNDSAQPPTSTSTTLSTGPATVPASGVAGGPVSGLTTQPPLQQPPPQSVATAPTSTYSTIPPNVAQVPLNPAVEPEYDNYTPHPHQATPELTGPTGMGPPMQHHQPPPHMHHPPPNHPPPHVHPAHPVASGGHGHNQGQMMLSAHDMVARAGAQVNSQPQQHEIVYSGGPIKFVTPPPHLPHHPAAPGAPAEMTASGTPVVSAIADAPSVEIKPYQKQKRKPPSEMNLVQQQQPSGSVPHHHQQQQQQQQHTVDHQTKQTLPSSASMIPHHHHHQQQQQAQHLHHHHLPPHNPGSIETMPHHPPSLPYGEAGRYRTISEKSIAESTLSTDAEPFVYTGHGSNATTTSNQQQQQPFPVRIEEPAVAPTVPDVVVPYELQKQSTPPQQAPVQVVEVEKPAESSGKQINALVAGVENLSVVDNSSTATTTPMNQAGGYGSNSNNNNKKQKQHKKSRGEDPVASETSIQTSSSKAPATVVIEAHPPTAVAAVDETDRSVAPADAPQQQQQQSSSSLISNLVEHNASKLDNDNIINNNVDCTSTMITTTTDNTTDNSNTSPVMETTRQQQQQHTPNAKLDVDNNIQQLQQTEFDDNKNVVASTEDLSPVAPKQATPEATVVATKDTAPAAAAAAAATTVAAPAIPPIKKSRSITLIEYDPDQWSPDNPTGKRKYSRDQLMQLKNAPVAREKPAVLANGLENVLVRSNHGGGGGGGHGMGMGGGGGGGQYGKNNFSEMLLPTFIKDRMGGGGGGGGGGGNMGQMRQPYPAKRPSQQGNSGPSGPQSNKQSQQSMSKTGSKIIRLQLDEEVKLNECANAWRPRHLQNTTEATDDVDRVTQELFKKFRSVLNKLTPENFDKLVQQVKSFIIDTDERLDGCIKLVFEKAISEPNFSEAYAKMCKEIGNIAVLMSNEKRTSFKGRLLAQCQCEFERRRNDQTSAIRESRSKLEANKGLAKDQFEELKAQLEEEELRVRRRAVGTVRFIGELFKHGQLTANIMHSCIKLLIEKDEKDYDEETLECLCKLLTTVGSKMEKENDRDLTQYFDKMGEIVKYRDQYKISSRIRFMLQDVIDLRRNGWQPRRTDLNPKTMNQIAKEAETEQLHINMNYMPRGGGKDGGGYSNDMGRGNRGNMQGGSKMGSGSMSGGYNQGSLGRGGNQGSMKGGRQTDDDGFQQISNNRNNNRSLQIDPKKINIPGSVDTTRLGAASAYQGWKNTGNMFAALNNEDPSQGNMMDRDGRERDRSGSHNKNSGGKDSYHHKGSMERDRYNRYGSSSSQNDDRMGRSSREPSSGSLRKNMGKMSSQQQQQPMPSRSSQQRHIPQQSGVPSSSSSARIGSGSSSGGPTGGSGNPVTKSGSGQLYQQQQLPQFAIPKDAVRRNFALPDEGTEEKLLKLSQAVNVEMDESDIEESVKMLKDIKPDYYHAVISRLFSDNIERDSKSREMVVRVIALMFEKKVITKPDYLHALEEMFKMAEDLIIDLPQLYKYIATFYVLLLHKRFVSLNDVRGVAQDIINEHGAVMLKELLQQYESSFGRNATVMFWYESSLSFTDFIKLGSNDKVEKFLADARLEYLLDNGSKALDMQTVGAQIKQFLKSGVKFVEIFGWIADYVGPERETSDEFIRTLTKAVIEHCIDNKTKLNVPEIGRWHQVLQKYIDSKPDRELQAMYAIQRLVVELEHPQNLLLTILEQLYDNDVIMEGFTLWKDSTDPLEAAGKGVCLKGITQFMTMFMENSSEEDN